MSNTFYADAVKEIQPLYITMTVLLFPIDVVLFPLFTWWYCMIFAYTIDEAFSYGEEMYAWCLLNPWPIILFMGDWVDISHTGKQFDSRR